MKRTLLLLLCCCFCLHIQAQNKVSFCDLHRSYDGKTRIIADSLLRYGHFAEAIVAFRTSNEIRYHRNNTYRIAIAFCMLGQSDSAKIYMLEAIYHGFFYEHGSFETDQLLQCLRDREGHEKLATLLELNKANRFKNVDTALKNKLLLARDNGQRHFRSGIMDSLQRANDTIGLRMVSDSINYIRAANAYFLDSVIKALGRWPGYDVVGIQGSRAAGLIVQHADHFVDFQKRSLILMNEALKKNNATPHNVAFLFDRVMVNTGGNQRFGTQFRGAEALNLIDIENVDIHRRSFGLESFESYRQRMMRRFNLN